VKSARALGMDTVFKKKKFPIGFRKDKCKGYFCSNTAMSYQWISGGKSP